MLTFSKEVKEDLIKKKINNNDNTIFEYQALVDFLGDVKFIDNKEVLLFSSNSIALVNYFLKLSKELFGVSSDLVKVEQNSIKPYKMFSVQIADFIGIILSRINYYSSRDIGDIDGLNSEKKDSYIKGAFLASGSISNPRSQNYHLEISCDSKDDILYLQAIINSFDLNAKISLKRKKYICYIKSVKNITSFLYHIGSIKGYLELESVVEEKNMSNSIHRKMNIEIANERRCLDKAREIIDGIIKLKKRRIKLDIELELVADLRLEHDDLSLNELTKKYYEKYGRTITKSSLYRKYEKIKDLAAKY